MDQKTTKEIWKDVVGFEGSYLVSNLGRVKSLIKSGGRQTLKREKPYILNPYQGWDVYPTVNIKRRPRRVHRLVAEAFIPNPKKLKTINHKDLNRANNDVSNLEWLSQKDNVRHAFRNNAVNSARGEDISTGKLNKFQVMRLRLLKEISPKAYYSDLGRLFKISGTSASDAINRRSWKHIC